MYLHVKLIVSLWRDGEGYFEGLLFYKVFTQNWLLFRAQINEASCFSVQGVAHKLKPAIFYYA